VPAPYRRIRTRAQTERSGTRENHFQHTARLCGGAGLCSPFINFRFGVAETGSTSDGDRFAEGPLS
jgi:hypothetical protein